ncbi:uncharacterized protein LOC135495414 isoform X1 [Lineus longissimus]|uniref:uncharacterized protein LOC135495414 isoform X1 n=1 Tax=Lineus longissimus TaxID=88925 RepID=UPI002B4FAA32
MATSTLLVLVVMVTVVTSKCLIDRPDVKPKRNLYHGSSELNLTLEGSTRTSHQLANTILKILLEEVLGYKWVNIKVEEGNINAEAVVRRVSGLSNPNCSIPDTMVNLEVWMLPGFNVEAWVSSGHLIDCGPLGPLALFGWYMSSFTVDKFWKNNKHIIVDHYRSLMQPNFTQQFNYQDKLPRIESMMRDPITTRYYCTAADCDSGIYYSSRCRSGPNVESCAMLFSDYPATDSNILKNQIENFGLYVNIVWLGSHLASFVTEQTALNRPILFFNWRPNTFTSGKNFTRIAFPICMDDQQTARPLNCDFSINQLSKVVWAPLKTKAPEAFHLINQMSFTNQVYQNLLNTYREHSEQFVIVNRTRVYNKIGCEWIQSNELIWTRWLPHNLSNKTTIYIGGMISMTGTAYKDPGIAEVVSMATDLINKNTSLLADYNLKVLVQDTKCAPDEVMKAFIKYVTNKTHPIVAVLGPACSVATKPLARVSKHFNTTVLSYGAEALELSTKSIYPLFFRTVPNFGQYGAVFNAAFKEFGWKRVGMMVAVEHYAFLQHVFKTNGIEIVLYLQIPAETHSFDAEMHALVRQYLRQLKEKNVKIIIGEFYDYAARSVMCGALKLGMTAREGYQWFLPGWYEMGWWDTDRFNNPPEFLIGLSIKESVECSTKDMLSAIDGYMLLSQAYFDKDESIATGTGNISVGQWKKMYKQRLNKTGNSFKTVGNYAGYAFDAVWVYAYALDRLLSKYPSAIDSMRLKYSGLLLKYINQTDFKGVTGHLAFSGADRPGIILLQQFSASNNLTTIGRYVPVTKGGKMEINNSLIQWLMPRNEKPDDGTISPEVCSIESFRAIFGVDCNMAIVIATIFGFGSLVILLIVIPIMCIKKRYDKKSRETRARMKELGLMSPDVEWLNLDEWEMPREKVVLNRKLGEGAFGTVYGGEAYMMAGASMMQGSNWVACAVKTLKVGSSSHEKMDFLTEASLMKRFEDNNIVKLLGVCTRGEPAYCVMEFMLYGDLKTYMLARRQLVTKSPDNEEVSSLSLTKMALDVINGLKYLTDNKYVHRDLACRNCLVGDLRVVKIGDFGMTRPMIETDYYRFSKKGMLPVRWMAPESLSDGIFTPHSDIWSYGILLYEILTFGSFPYQGLSNNQVLEYVKNGNKLSIPLACTKEMQDLMEACWRFDFPDRPTPDAIRDYLTERPQLIKPCLDTPSSAVVIEGTDSLEFALPSTRKHTTTSRSFSGSAAAGLLTVNPAEIAKLIAKNEDSTTVTRSNSGDSFTAEENVGYVTIGTPDPVGSCDHLNHSKEFISGSRERVTRHSIPKLFGSKDKIPPLVNRDTKPKEILKHLENDRKNHVGNNVHMSVHYSSLPLDNGDCGREQLTQV